VSARITLVDRTVNTIKSRYAVLLERNAAMASKSTRSFWRALIATLPISLCLVVAVNPIMTLSDFMADKKGPAYCLGSWTLPVGILGAFLVLVIAVGQLGSRVERLEAELDLLRQPKPGKGI
jgi:hypothetical protein